MTGVNSWPAWQIETARLRLRCFDVEDAAAFRSLLDRNNEHLRPWIPWMKQEPLSLPDTAQRLRQFQTNFRNNKEFRYAICHLESGRLIGLAGLHTRVGPDVLEIGYLLDRNESGKGYALETVRALLRVAFELHAIPRVEIHCAPENVASARIPEKLGFTHEKTFEQHTEDSEGSRRDSMLWSMSREAYEQTSLNAISVRAFDTEGQAIALESC